MRVWSGDEDEDETADWLIDIWMDGVGVYECTVHACMVIIYSIGLCISTVSLLVQRYLPV